MTREEALKTWLPVIKMGVESMPECSEALDMAIEALEQEPCTNAISREDALMALTGEWKESRDEILSLAIPTERFVFEESKRIVTIILIPP